MKDFAGIAQLVEHNLAKVGVASSSLVSRSIILAEWQSGYAADCKFVDIGSIPVSASKNFISPFYAMVVKSVYTADLKSADLKVVGVQVPPFAILFLRKINVFSL